jgi:hypothetical protein
MVIFKIALGVSGPVEIAEEASEDEYEETSRRSQRVEMRIGSCVGLGRYLRTRSKDRRRSGVVLPFVLLAYATPFRSHRRNRKGSIVAERRKKISRRTLCRVRAMCWTSCLHTICCLSLHNSFSSSKTTQNIMIEFLIIIYYIIAINFVVIPGNNVPWNCRHHLPLLSPIRSLHNGSIVIVSGRNFKEGADGKVSMLT